jgi:hypothetical protein
MDKTFQAQVDALMEKYTELLLGSTSGNVTEKVKLWALYTHISKSMPALAKHWNEMYPEAKAEMVKVVGEIKALNEAHRMNTKKE